MTLATISIAEIMKIYLYVVKNMKIFLLVFILRPFSKVR